MPQTVDKVVNGLFFARVKYTKIYGGTPYTGIYTLGIGETPYFDFEYYEDINSYLYENVQTTETYSNLNMNLQGYYYTEFTGISSEVNVIFRIIFKVGNPPLDATPKSERTYHYDENWLDKLKSYDIILDDNTLTQNFTYDNQGNPILITNFKYKGEYKDEAILSWDGQELSELTIKDNGVIIAFIEYKYNDQGYRISKKITEGTSIQTIEYTLSGDKVVYETDGTYRIIYSYDYDGNIISFNYDNNIFDSVVGIEYFYIRNQQGDITIITDCQGNKVAEYRYDAWGNIINEPSEWALNVNRYTYRGYRYDVETSLYYCNSRYYNPEWGRWLNADDVSYLDPSSVNGLNLYAYCGNNPVMRVDPNGNAWYHWVIGGVVILGSLALTVATAGGFAAAGGAMLSVFTSTMAVNGAAAFWAGAFVGSTILGAVGIGVGGLIGSANGDGFWEGASQGFMIGAITGAVVGGVWGRAHFALQEAGKMSIKAHSSTINTIQKHLNNPMFGHFEGNDLMISRLQQGGKLMGADRNFFLHELKEFSLMNKGMLYEAAHAQTLAYYNVSNFALYHPEVILSLPGQFGPGWLAFWGL